jgi:hypothetical protein
MAQGTMKLFEEFAKSGMSFHDFDRVAAGTDTLSVIFITEATGTIETTATPDRSDFTETSNGGGYTTGGIEIAAPTWTETGGVGTLDHNAGEAFITWTSQAGSPTDIKTALLVNDAVAATYDCIAILDMTADGGTTAISLVAGDITITWGGSGIFTCTNP